MAVTDKLNFKQSQLKKFARLLRQARLTAGLTQLQVAKQAFGYEVSHCKVSRVERAIMRKVDAHCIEAMAHVLDVPSTSLLEVDPQFKDRAVIVREATRRGFWRKGALNVRPELCVR